MVTAGISIHKWKHRISNMPISKPNTILPTTHANAEKGHLERPNESCIFCRWCRCTNLKLGWCAALTGCVNRITHCWMHGCMRCLNALLQDCQLVSEGHSQHQNQIDNQPRVYYDDNTSITGVGFTSSSHGYTHNNVPHEFRPKYVSDILPHQGTYLAPNDILNNGEIVDSTRVSLHPLLGSNRSYMDTCSDTFVSSFNVVTNEPAEIMISPPIKSNTTDEERPSSIGSSTGTSSPRNKPTSLCRTNSCNPEPTCTFTAIAEPSDPNVSFKLVPSRVATDNTDLNGVPYAQQTVYTRDAGVRRRMVRKESQKACTNAVYPSLTNGDLLTRTTVCKRDNGEPNKSNGTEQQSHTNIGTNTTLDINSTFTSNHVTDPESESSPSGGTPMELNSTERNDIPRVAILQPQLLDTHHNDSSDTDSSSGRLSTVDEGTTDDESDSEDDPWVVWTPHENGDTDTL